jgi:hypothetical protein
MSNWYAGRLGISVHREVHKNGGVDLGVERLADLIASQLKRPNEGAILGQYQGDTVLINGRSYPCDLAVDQDIGVGDYVWAVLSSDGIAVVVGTCI